MVSRFGFQLDIEEFSVMAKVDRVTGEVKFSLPVLRSSYDDFNDRSQAGDLLCLDESLASQSDAEEADINVLVKRFGIGEVPIHDVRAPSYGDFTGLKSPHEMAQALVEAQAAFMALPAVVRSEFANDPHAFVDFCSKDENYDRICDLGLLAPEPMSKRVGERRAAEKAALDAKVEAEIQARSKAANSG